MDDSFRLRLDKIQPTFIEWSYPTKYTLSESEWMDIIELLQSRAYLRRMNE